MESSSHAWENEFSCSNDDEIEWGGEHSIESPSMEEDDSPNENEGMYNGADGF